MEHFSSGDQLDDIEVESDTEKKLRLSKINDNKVTKIDDKNEKNQAMLGVYQLFLGLSMISLFVGIIMLGVVIYHFV